MIDDVTAAHVRAFRWARHGLDRASPTASADVLHLGVQDTPGGSALLALSVRSPAPIPAAPGVEGTSLVWSVRGAPHLHPTADLSALAAALWPTDDADAAARLLHLAPRLGRAGIGPLEGWRRAAEVMRAVVDRPRPTADVSRRMTEQLPEAFSAWCEGCGTVHVDPLLFPLVALGAGVEMEPGGHPPVLRPVADRYPVPPRAAGTDVLVRRYLHLHGPAAPADVAAFLATRPPSIRPAWPDDAVPVRVEGRPAVLLPEDLADFAAARRPQGVRLLAPHDPLLEGRDREVLVPGAALRHELWRTGGPGAVLVDGDVVGHWRVHAHGEQVLRVTVTPSGDWATERTPELVAESERLAVTRGRGGVEVELEV